jgi:ABC-type polysaccharide/polyol phosphate transport system ATPase subunit
MSQIYLQNASVWIPARNPSGGDAAKIGAPVIREGRRSYAKVLDQINLHVKSGDRVGVVGLNGSGKTSLLRLMAGIYPATSGKVIIDGTIAPMLTSGIGLSAELSGRENIAVAARIFGIPAQRLPALLEDVVEFSEIGSYLERPLRTYSAGMRARLTFGLVTAIDASILLIDEVIGAGDPTFRRRSAERLRERAGNAEILVLATHSLNLLETFCDRLIWIHRGELRGYGLLNEVYGEYLAFQDSSASMKIEANKSYAEQESERRNRIRNERKAAAQKNKKKGSPA